MLQQTRYVVDKNMRFMLALLKLNEVQVLQKAELPIDLLNKATVTLSVDEYHRLWTAIVESNTDGEPIPLIIERLPTFGMVSVPIMAALYSSCFRVFVQRMSEYKPLIGPLLFDVQVTEDELALTIKHVEESKPVHPLIVLIEMMFMVKLIRESTGFDVVPTEVTQVAIASDERYVEYMGISPKVGTENTLRFAREDVERPFLLADEAIWQQFEPELRTRLNELEVDASYAAKVRSVLVELLPLGECSIEKVAEKFCVSPRTLQRKLKTEDTNYQQQLNHCRELLAKHYLKETPTTITEIAFLLGFEDPSSFSRAFHTWSGVSPDSYRQQFS